MIETLSIPEFSEEEISGFITFVGKRYNNLIAKVMTGGHSLVISQDGENDDNRKMTPLGKSIAVEMQNIGVTSGDADRYQTLIRYSHPKDINTDDFIFMKSFIDKVETIFQNLMGQGHSETDIKR